jgi:hypothetical protein
MPKPTSFLIYKITIFLLFNISMYPWFFWSLSPVLFYILGSLVSVVFFLLNRKSFTFTRRNVLVGAILLFTFAIYSIGFSIFGAIEQIMVFINVLIVFHLKDEVKYKLFDFITRGMGYLVGVSLVFYIMHLFGVSLPFTLITESKLGYTAINYYVFIIDPEATLFFRFSGIYAEPGHLTMGLIPLLFANRFNLKNIYVVIFLVAELLTLSLAGYIVMALSLVLFCFSKSIETIYPRIILFILLTVGTIYVSSLKENDLIYITIVSRLLIDEDKGTIAGDNRTGVDVDDYYEKFIKTPDVFFGVGHEEFDRISEGGGAAGYKVFIIRFGLLATFFVLLLFTIMAFNYWQYDVWCFWFLVILMLLQNSYPFWLCFIWGYILGLAKLNEKKRLYIDSSENSKLLLD